MSLPAGTFSESYAQDMGVIRTRLQWMITIATIVLLFTLPLFCSSTIMHYANFICISIVAALGLQILMGYCGQISMGHAAFVAVGSYSSAILTATLGLPFWIALPLAGVSAGLVGLLFGLPSLRVKGFYLAMATLAAQFIIPWVIINVWPDITKGTQSFMVPSPTIGDYKFNTQQSMFFIILPVTLLSIFIAKNLVRTRLGRAFIAIRDNDLASEVMGVNNFKYKLIAFFICSCYAGIAGSLYAHWMRVINIEHFALMESVWYLGMLIVGGMGSIAGAVMGAIFIRLLDTLSMELTPLVGAVFPMGMQAVAPFFFGLVIIVFLIFEPRGLYHRWTLFKLSYRLWPFSN
jgi:branched-chain amino acid transport system permease protein